MTSSDGFEGAYVGLFATADRVAGAVLGDAGGAEDVAVETLARALRSWRRIHDRAEPWVIRTATDLSLDRLGVRPGRGLRWRRRAAAAPGTGAPAPSDTAPSDTAPSDTAPAGPAGDDGVSRAHVLDGVRRLSRPRAWVIALRYLVGMDDEAVAATLGLSPAVVAARLEEALTALRVELPEEDLPTGEVPVVAAPGGPVPAGASGGGAGAGPGPYPTTGAPADGSTGTDTRVLTGVDAPAVTGTQDPAPPPEEVEVDTVEPT